MTRNEANDRYTHDFPAMINIVMLNSLGFFFLGFLIPVVARNNMNASATEIGIIVSLIVIGALIIDPLIGYVTDRMKSKTQLIFIGSLGRGASYFIIYSAIIINSLWLLGLGTFILGVMVSFFWVPFDSLVAEKSNKDNRSHAYGKREAATAKGQIIGALAGFAILVGLGLFTDNPFLLYAAIPLYGISNIIGGILYIVKVDESVKFPNPEPFNDPAKNDLSAQKATPFPRPMVLGLVMLLMVVLMSAINGNIAKPFLNIYVLENITSNLFLVIIAYIPAGLLSTILAPKLGQYIDKLNPRIAITTAACLGAIVTWLVINTKILWVFMILLMVDYTIALSGGLIFKNLLSRVNIQNRGKIMGFASFFMNLGAAIGPIIGGIVWDISGPKAPFIVSIFVELSLIPLYWMVYYLLIPHLAEQYNKKNGN